MASRSSKLLATTSIQKQATKRQAAKKAAKPSQEDVQIQKLMAELEKCKAKLASEKGKTAQFSEKLNQDKETMARTQKAIDDSDQMTAECKRAVDYHQNRLEAIKNHRNAYIEAAKRTLKTFERGQEEMDQLAEQYRKRCGDWKNGQEKKPWLICEVCLEPYSHQQAHTPRILGCGHTMCLSCCEKNSEGNIVQCPFERKFTSYNKQLAQCVVKNFSILNMCT